MVSQSIPFLIIGFSIKNNLNMDKQTAIHTDLEFACTGFKHLQYNLDSWLGLKLHSVKTLTNPYKNKKLCDIILKANELDNMDTLTKC